MAGHVDKVLGFFLCYSCMYSMYVGTLLHLLCFPLLLHFCFLVCFCLSSGIPVGVFGGFYPAVLFPCVAAYCECDCFFPFYGMREGWVRVMSDVMSRGVPPVM